MNAQGAIDINGSSLPLTIEALVDGDGEAGILMSSSGEGISITDELVQALVMGDGSASIGMETGGDITITDSHIEASVEGDNTYQDDNYPSISMGADGLIAIDGSGLPLTIESLVDGDGEATISLGSGEGISITDELALAHVGGDGSASIGMETGGG